MGSAAAIHLLSEAGWCRPMQVTVAGRRPTKQMAPVQREIIEVRSRFVLLPAERGRVCMDPAAAMRQ